MALHWMASDGLNALCVARLDGGLGNIRLATPLNGDLHLPARPPPGGWIHKRER